MPRRLTKARRESVNQEEAVPDVVRDLLAARAKLLRIELEAVEAALRDYESRSESTISTRRPSHPAELTRRTDMIGAREAAVILGVCHKTVTAYQKSGAIPGTRIGRLYKFQRAEIERLVRT